MTTKKDDAGGSNALGAALKDARLATGKSLRDVEHALTGEISNAYLSQLENGRAASPSPQVLHALSTVLPVPYERLMTLAGYLKPGKGTVAAFGGETLTDAEHADLMKYLAFLRSRKGK
ncbi:MAG: helix-turn-helix domain-containing protein [Planctomycetes bacterium]|nr:helix-turn-helix domain-containing protein [Planctomycetota bacterium]